MLKALVKYIMQVILNIRLWGAMQEVINDLEYFDFN